MTNLRRALLASAAVAVSVPALPATASADPIFRCSATFLVGPVRCELADRETEIRERYPVVDELLNQIDPA